jgi:tight adherence protein B
MPLLFAGFFFILFACLGVVLFVTRTTPEEKLVNHRLCMLRSETNAASQSTAAGHLMKTGLQSGRSWIAAVLERYEFARKMQTLIIQADSKTTLEQLAVKTLAFGCVGFFLTYFFITALPVQLLAAVLLGTLPYFMLAYKRSTRVKAFNAELSKAVDMMSNALRAGHSVVGAIGILSEQTLEPTASEFKEVFRQQNFGLPLRDALMQLLDRVPSQDLRVVVTAILVQKDTGGNLGEILDRTVTVIRERIRIRGDIQVQTAQGRMTGWILTLLPVILLLVINVINPGYSQVLFHESTGRKLIYVGLGLLVAGGMSIRHIINSIEV